jgi:hypothetical protein
MSKPHHTDEHKEDKKGVIDNDTWTTTGHVCRGACEPAEHIQQQSK